jgi:hypothetical protein
MNDLIVVENLAEWDRLKTLVLDSVSSPITRRVYNLALDEFIGWYRHEPRPGFTKATVSAWRWRFEVSEGAGGLAFGDYPLDKDYLGAWHWGCRRLVSVGRPD